MRGRERVLVLCWGISWRGHSGRCFGWHFPCRHSSADLYKVILSRAGVVSVAASSFAGRCVALTFHPTEQSIRWGGWAAPCLGRPRVLSRALCVVYATGCKGRVSTIRSSCKGWMSVKRPECGSCSHKEQNHSRDDHALGCAVTSVSTPYLLEMVSGVCHLLSSAIINLLPATQPLNHLETDSQPLSEEYTYSGLSALYGIIHACSYLLTTLVISYPLLLKYSTHAS